MAPSRRRLLGVALLSVAAAIFSLASTVTPGFVPGVETASDLPPFITPSPFSAVAAPALLAIGSVLLVSGAAALAAVDLSARLALLAPVIGVLVALGFALGFARDPAASLHAVVESGTLATVRSGTPAAAGAAFGGAVAPVVRAATTEDTVALLVGAALLLASVATTPGSVFALVSGGVAGALAVGALWAVDPATWRP
jgi:hypothetical protein